MAKTIDLKSLDSTTLTQFRNRNLWRRVIQNNLNAITKDLLSADTAKSYELDPREALKILERRMKPSHSQN